MFRFLLIPLLFLAAGCRSHPDVPAESLGLVDWSAVAADSERTAFERLRVLDRNNFDDAWESMSSLRYSVERTLSVRDAENTVVARATETLLVAGSPGSRTTSVISSDSVGRFERSFWSRFAVTDSAEGDDWPGLVLPEDPLFLSTQGPSFFRYAAAGDTLIGGTRVTRFEIAARPDASRQGIQWARLYLDGRTLVAIKVLYAHNSLLYREISDFSIYLGPTPDGFWLPEHVRFESKVGLPFSRSRTYELSASYTQIQPL